MSEVPLHPVRHEREKRESECLGVVWSTSSSLLIKEVEIKSIREKLARAADTEQSN
jgi:hypothetical protein